MVFQETPFLLMVKTMVSGEGFPKIQSNHGCHGCQVVVLDVLPDGVRVVRNRGGHRTGSDLWTDGLHRRAGHLLLLPWDTRGLNPCGTLLEKIWGTETETVLRVDQWYHLWIYQWMIICRIYHFYDIIIPKDVPIIHKYP